MRRCSPANVALFVFLTVSPAFAADLPYYKAPLVPAIYGWTGCYIGGEGGGAWGTSNHTAESGRGAGQTITGDFSIAGGLAGGTIGCNYQFGSWVFGAEDDMSWINTKGSTPDLPPFNVNSVSTTQQNWLDTLRGRLGWTWGRTLIYATGGAAFTGADVSACPLAGCVSQSKTVTGWTVGAGVEYAFLSGWSVKLEYLYADFGSPQFINPPIQLGAGTVVTRDVRLDENIVRVGLNYRFNWHSFSGPWY
jgi:outer membrane immunogenic protein